MTQVARSILASVLTLALWPAAAGAQSAAPSAVPAPAAAASAEPTPPPLPDNPAVDKRAKAEFLAWQTGKLDKSGYTAALTAAATDEVLGQVSPQLKALGDFKSLTFTAGWVVKGSNAYQYLVTCANGSMLMLFVVSAEGKTAGVRFRPAQPTQ